VHANRFDSSDVVESVDKLKTPCHRTSHKTLGGRHDAGGCQHWSWSRCELKLFTPSQTISFVIYVSPTQR